MDRLAERARSGPAGMAPQAMLRLQHLAGNRAVASSVQRMCGADDSKLIVEDSAMKHKVALGGAPAQNPTAEQVKRQFHVNMKFGKPQPDDRDPTSTTVTGGGAKMVFKRYPSGDIKIFHFHAYAYEGDQGGSSSTRSTWSRGGSRPTGRGWRK